MISKTPFEPNTEGVWLDLPSEIYHRAPGLSHSMCKNMDPPARLPVYLSEKREATAAMIMGTLVHQAILEPDLPFPKIAVKPEGMKFSTTEGKVWRDRQISAGRRLILTQAEWDALNGCIMTLSESAACKEIFANGKSEVSVFARDPASGVLLKARMDFVPDGDALADIKTCLCKKAGKDEFSKILFDSRYFTQAGWYLRLWNQIMPEEPKKHFVFIPVEKEAPYLSTQYFVGKRTLEIAAHLNALDIATYHRCMAAKEWPGYPQECSELNIPGWAMAKLENVQYSSWLAQVQSAKPIQDQDSE